MKLFGRASREQLFLAFLLFLLFCSGQVVAGQTSRQDAYSNNLSRWNVPVFSMGNGMAYAADVRGVHGGLTNPAGLSRIQERQFSIEYQRWGENWNLYNTGIAVPISGGHAYALQLSWLDYGELEPLEEDELYRPQGNEFKSNFTYSRFFANRISFGASIGVMSSKMGFLDRKTEPTADLGLLLRLNPGFWLGMTGKNLNSSLKFDDKENKLPPEYRWGTAMYLFEDRIGLTADLVYIETENREDFRSEDIGMAGGLRLMFSKSFRLSFGYHSLYGNGEDAGLTGGLNLKYPGLRWNLGLLDTGSEAIVRGGGSMRF